VEHPRLRLQKNKKKPDAKPILSGLKPRPGMLH